MADTTPEQESLSKEAQAINHAIAEIDAAAEKKYRERVEIMKRMREAQMSWAAIGRAFKVTPQAAMYATGAAVRTPKPSRRREAEQA